jgi:hypothetical protein
LTLARVVQMVKRMYYIVSVDQRMGPFRTPAEAGRVWRDLPCQFRGRIEASDGRPATARELDEALGEILSRTVQEAL